MKSAFGSSLSFSTFGCYEVSSMSHSSIDRLVVNGFLFTDISHSSGNTYMEAHTLNMVTTSDILEEE